MFLRGIAERDPSHNLPAAMRRYWFGSHILLDQVCTYKACPGLINNECSALPTMTTPTIDIWRSPLFNETLKGQHPSHKGSPHDARKPNKTSVNHPNIIEELYGTTRKPRSFKQWEDAARENTQQIKARGSLSPLVF